MKFRVKNGKELKDIPNKEKHLHYISSFRLPR
jgi:hypothetical protein